MKHAKKILFFRPIRIDLDLLRIIIDGCPGGDVVRTSRSSAPRPDVDRTPPPRSHHNIDIISLDQTVHPMSPLDQSKIIRETMQAYHDSHGTSPTTWLSEAAASAYIYVPESYIYPDDTNIVSPILTNHVIRDHDDCQVVGCTDTAPCCNCIGDSCSSPAHRHDSSDDDEVCDPDTDDSFISTSEPLTPTTAAGLGEAILSLGQRPIANTATDTTASDLTTIALVTTRPRRVKRGPAPIRAASLNGNSKITDYFTPPNVD